MSEPVFMLNILSFIFLQCLHIVCAAHIDPVKIYNEFVKVWIQDRYIRFSTKRNEAPSNSIYKSWIPDVVPIDSFFSL